MENHLKPIKRLVKLYLVLVIFDFLTIYLQLKTSQRRIETIIHLSLSNWNWQRSHGSNYLIHEISGPGHCFFPPKGSHGLWATNCLVSGWDWVYVYCITKYRPVCVRHYTEFFLTFKKYHPSNLFSQHSQHDTSFFSALFSSSFSCIPFSPFYNLLNCMYSIQGTIQIALKVEICSLGLK